MNAQQKQAADKGKPRPVTKLTGRLVGSKSGWVLLEVPNAFVRGLFSALDVPGAELPPNPNGGNIRAHISVMRKEEVDEIGGLDKVTEIGKQFHYQLGELKEVEPGGWEEMERAWLVEVRSPELQRLRKSYGLPSEPRVGSETYKFHITVAVRRKGVLRSNSTSKVAGFLNDYWYYLNKNYNPWSDAWNDPDVDGLDTALKYTARGAMGTGLAAAAGAGALGLGGSALAGAGANAVGGTAARAAGGAALRSAAQGGVRGAVGRWAGGVASRVAPSTTARVTGAASRAKNLLETTRAGRALATGGRVANNAATASMIGGYLMSRGGSAPQGLPPGQAPPGVNPYLPKPAAQTPGAAQPGAQTAATPPGGRVDGLLPRNMSPDAWLASQDAMRKGFKPVFAK